MTNSSSLFEFGLRRRPREQDPRDARIAALEADNALLREAMGKATETCRRVAAGDFEARATHIEHLGDAVPFLRHLNRILDLTDVFIRETMASLEFASRGDLHRPFLETGMVGSFREGARTINEARARMKALGDEAHTARHALADSFERSVGDLVAAVAGAAGRMAEAADGVAAIADGTQNRAEAVAAASDQAAAGSQAVAAATNEMAASIDEISRQTHLTSDLSGTVAAEATTAGGTVQRLAEAAQSIDDVVKLIQQIANQTNLLALNATIEAARAGDAGRGFAVVAGEVKALARQTAEATVKIGRQAQEMKDRTGVAVVGIDRIVKATDDLRDAAASISSAVEEQTAATREISTNVEQVASGSQEVTAHIAQVSAGATDTAAAAQKMKAGATDLAELAQRLRGEVDRFLREVRAA
jgi:methyl-accepting chemotaxis protein